MRRRHGAPGVLHGARPWPTRAGRRRLGTDVLRYRLARVIGEGGMGKVYLAVQPQIGSRVAIKILAPHIARSPDQLERFFGEGRAVNLVKHENIVSIIDMAQLPDGRPLIVMEYIDGVTLGHLVRTGPVPLATVARVIVEVLGALDAAHGIGIVHRDVKPDNVLVTAKGHAKVLDFGIAKLAPEIAESTAPRTRTGALLGTPSYMAPEQISGTHAIDARTDIYAAGVMLYEAVTGRLPFTGATVFDLMRAHVDDPPPSPRALRPELPPAMEAVILTALAKDPARRYPSAAAMAGALERAAARLPGAAPAPRARSPRRWAAPVIGGGALLGCAVGAIVFALRGAPPPAPPATPAMLDAAAAVASGAGSDAEPTLTARYDPRRFEFRSFMRPARRLAREVFPDAMLVELDARGAFPDGHMDLAVAARAPQYVFRSEAETAMHRACIVLVTVRPTGPEVTTDPARSCGQPIAGVPDCGLPWLWARAREAGTHAEHADAIWTRGTWRFIAPDLDQTFAAACGDARPDER